MRLDENNDYGKQQRNQSPKYKKEQPEEKQSQRNQSPKYKKEQIEEKRKINNSNMVLPNIHGIGSVRMPAEPSYNRNNYHSVEK
jgi:hypothetical protein